MKILLASRNRDKQREIREKVSSLHIEILTPDDFPDLPEVVEDGDTLEENASKKARTLHQLTGVPTIADDTGLEVDFLNGQPGVYSARYAGPDATYQDNVDKLIRELQGVPEGQRGARFRCVIAYIRDGQLNTFEGKVDGFISKTPAGESGFGYDPVFYVSDEGKTFAELQLERKNAISHRGLALDAWVDHLRKEIHITDSK
ncbi:non-canonical purine NTP pyrophosphatase [candidate division LCP-89 bacterium B3_LCP]|uniref:dITP/XTP pyrophosphatase n=1 Tax=candidate division LCP-89 bacterium B3_LCP TaxID=2012998 RepID=A0A532UY50_UNCL8|nr:MAG: non-canonical purine NTP pyrophosphatase [candidate division LCP-89 bacterium B3_LCP]